MTLKDLRSETIPLFPAHFFFLCKIVLINEHCNVPVYSQGLLKMQTVSDSVIQSDMGDFVLAWSLGRKDVLQFR